MAKPDFIELGDETRIPIVYEDRTALVIDKPRGWILAPTDWETTRNLQAALEGSIAAKEFWAKSRNLKFVRYVHRLDAETTGLLLLAKSLGAVRAYTELFAGGKVRKKYLVVVNGAPKQEKWVCRLSLAEESAGSHKVHVDKAGKPAETLFRVLRKADEISLLEAEPVTGRTHQIRAHLAAEGFPIVGDALYGATATKLPLGLRAVELSYRAPFTGKDVRIRARVNEFLGQYGFAADAWPEQYTKPPQGNAAQGHGR